MGAPQFKLLTDELALCWVHEGRHYKKLSPYIAYHQKILDNFLDRFWTLFREKTGYEELDERKRLTIAKQQELLLVLEHPELPLHNNPAELAARTMVLRRKISYSTQTWMGTKSWDIFMSLVDTTRKLGISFFEYISDRTSKAGRIPPLG